MYTLSITGYEWISVKINEFVNEYIISPVKELNVISPIKTVSVVMFYNILSSIIPIYEYVKALIPEIQIKSSQQPPTLPTNYYRPPPTNYRPPPTNYQPPPTNYYQPPPQPTIFKINIPVPPVNNNITGNIPVLSNNDMSSSSNFVQEQQQVVEQKQARTLHREIQGTLKAAKNILKNNEQDQKNERYLRLLERSKVRTE